MEMKRADWQIGRLPMMRRTSKRPWEEDREKKKKKKRYAVTMFASKTGWQVVGLQNVR
jgi:hypothetical protein